MATYCIGDLHGCFEALLRLLKVISFDKEKDILWFTGDLVNRGPDSLGAIRFAKNLGEGAVSVMGNHDLHLLARAEGIRQPQEGDTLEGILNASDKDELLDWLARRPFVHTESIGANSWLMVHGGLWPTWSLEKAIALSKTCSGALKEDRCSLLKNLYEGAWPMVWRENLDRNQSIRAAITSFVRLRTINQAGMLDDKFTGPPNTIPKGSVAWYNAHPRLWMGKSKILFGHWAAHGLLMGEHVVSLDTGCVWGNRLSAMRLEDQTIFQVPSSP